MRLKKIKVAGFKSFVDPTTLELRSQLVGVVGPNGCGKSNVIDAVRWVMGESSAKNLRGESMSDVIFNGSSGRKPVGQASVEMVFDNSDGTLGGEYSAFAEISIRRQATRDGKSDYFLNGTRCRRRDIQDVFLGTGLGPRSYSIIEQGMISRVIEAKPEELRGFLEEAAGISIYKKRRHQTELRINHTRDNLSRVEDLLQEQNKMVERLKRQSEAAKRYKELHSEKTTIEGELFAIQWEALESNLEVHSADIRRLANQVEERLTERVRIETEMETERLQHTEKSDVLNKIQSQYYEVGAQVARLEQSIEHHQDRQKQLIQDLSETDDQVRITSEQLEKDEEQLTGYQQQLEEIEPNYEQSSEQLELLRERHAEAEEALQSWQDEWDDYQEQSSSVQRTAEVEKTKIEQLDKLTRDSQKRLERLQEEAGRLSLSGLQEEIDQQNVVIVQKDEILKQQQSDIQKLNDDMQEQKKQNRSLEKSLDKVKLELQTEKGRLASLEALQQAAKGDHDQAINDWLVSANLKDAKRLCETISVTAGYETAVETVLGQYLQAVCVSDLQSLEEKIDELSEGSLILAEQIEPVSGQESIDKNILSKYVTGSKLVTDILNHVLYADTLNDALSLRNGLASHESIVTKEGVWLGKNWLRVHRGDTTQGGLIARENQIKELTLALESLEQQLETQHELLELGQGKLDAYEQERQEVQKGQQITHRELTQLTSHVSAKKARLDQSQERLRRIEAEREELTEQLQEAEQESSRARFDLEAALEAMAEMTFTHDELSGKKESLQEVFRKSKEDYKAYQDQFHQMSLFRQTLTTQIKGTEEGLERLRQQLQQAVHKQTTLKASLVQEDNPVETLRLQLDELLDKRLTIEKSLDKARAELQEIDSLLQKQDKQRHELEKAASEARNELDSVRMKWQALDVRRQTIEEQVTKAHLSLDEIRQGLPEEADEKVWTARMEELEQKIQRLGAINLAAIEEYESESERLMHLESQFNDLNEALETLENAIRKIDKETKARFKETFETVNSQFKTLYPKLFGGGQAYLELTDDDMLQAGVTVMARPPGKRNSSIHLLSGGEKALTAVALVFAIFELNPAPFCMLDEVDAPLDDSNVARYCNLIKHMSDSVQFIFITHNKLTMEIAHQLSGVTMKEPGVSRLVQVDVDEAVAMADG